jgi:hypothetical protein
MCGEELQVKEPGIQSRARIVFKVETFNISKAAACLIRSSHLILGGGGGHRWFG